jgi:lactoylglutathione lyase
MAVRKSRRTPKRARKTARKGRVARPRRVPARRTRSARPAAKRTRSARPAAKRTRSARPAAKRGRSAARRAPAATAPNAIGFLNQHLDYTSHDVESVKHFYTEILGFTDAQYMPEYRYLAVRTGATSSLGFMPPMPGPPEQWRPPREPTIYIAVADVDRAHRELVSRGVTFEQPPTDMPWGHRVAQLRDPEGRSITLAEVKKP